MLHLFCHISTQKGSKSLENMLDDLNFYWLEKITYTRVLAEPEFNAATLPPVIAPLLRAQQVLNTEGEKKSVYLSANADGESRLFTSGRTYRNANSAASLKGVPTLHSCSRLLTREYDLASLEPN